MIIRRLIVAIGPLCLKRFPSTGKGWTLADGFFFCMKVPIDL